jgi:hypothetical protein
MPSQDRAWLEGVQLSYVFALMSRERLDYITGPIREGFRANFLQEGSSGGGWRRLASRTVYEREELMHSEGFLGLGQGGLVAGFSPQHPILQRSGQYMASWVNLGHHDHGRSDVSFGNVSRLIAEGSDDYRAEALSMGDIVSGGTLPPRPVHHIGGLYEESIRAKIDAMLSLYIQTVHP